MNSQPQNDMNHIGGSPWEGANGDIIEIEARVRCNGGLKRVCCDNTGDGFVATEVNV